jgi:hypothetical protein
MQSGTDSSYTGTVIVCTSAIAVLNWELGFGNVCVYMALGELLERGIWVLRIYVVHVMYKFLILILQCAAFEKFGMIDLVLRYKTVWAQHCLT